MVSAGGVFSSFPFAIFRGRRSYFLTAVWSRPLSVRLALQNRPWDIAGCCLCLGGLLACVAVGLVAWLSLCFWELLFGMGQVFVKTAGFQACRQHWLQASGV